MPESRRLFVPEVVQSSTMDCGPAALKGFLEGHGVRVSYGRLREACQTDVDGTSIETLEALSLGFGVPLEQVLLPKDAVLFEEARAFPSIGVFRLANGNTHFVVLWSQAARFVQVMDPALGRRWLSREALRRELYLHEMTVPASEWREWAASEEGLSLLRRRLEGLGVSPGTSVRLVSEALEDEGGRRLAALDAAVRFLSARGGSAEAELGLAPLFERARVDPAAVPERFWSVRPGATPGSVRVRGAVLLRKVASPIESSISEPSVERVVAVAARDPSPRPLRDLVSWLVRDGRLMPSVLLGAAFTTALAIVLEGLLYRALLSSPALYVPVLVFLAAVLVLHGVSVTSELRLGRSLERRLRLAFQRKLPRLSDRYFRSRLTSDMAERQHSLHLLRKLPRLFGQIARDAFELLLTGAAIVWLAPSTWPITVAAVAAAVAIPLLVEPVFFERDARVRSHLGGLSRFYLDSLLGLVSLRVHGAEKAIRSEHEGLLGSWAHARLSLQRASVALEALQFATGYGLVVLLVVVYLRNGGDRSGVLLLAYWALNLPVLGLSLVRLLWRYPESRNVFLRVSEPLLAPEEIEAAPSADGPSQPRAAGRGMAVALERVSVTASGHRLLEGLDLSIEPSSHVAIVGPSGAGKTTFLGLLLGLHFPDEGRVLVDGSPLSGARLPDVRSRIAWVDPSLQIWNRSMRENLRYGNGSSPEREDRVLVDLADVLERLPEGVESRLGEGGGLVSGGEGQRVRFGRALLRDDVRLALLDEPFRGLGRSRRAQFLEKARERWSEATLLVVTHDLRETLGFDRVLVLENGRVVEDGSPEELSLREGSRYRALLDRERELEELWSEGGWRVLEIEDGVLKETRR
jgi:ATP-binding cassette subfamily B protein